MLVRMYLCRKSRDRPQRRVEQSGGHVTVDEVGRHMVNGRLAMTRSIGDLHLKRVGVTAFPDTRSLEVSGGGQLGSPAAMSTGPFSRGPLPGDLCAMIVCHGVLGTVLRSQWTGQLGNRR